MVGTSETSQATLALDEGRLAMARQLELVRELDDKAETIMRLGIFTLTGLAVFLTYALRPDSAVAIKPTARVLLLVGALSQFISFYALLEAYGVLGTRREIAIGPEVPARRHDPSVGGEVFSAVAASYRRILKRNARVYGRASQGVSLGALTLFFAALMYLAAIFITVG